MTQKFVELLESLFLLRCEKIKKISNIPSIRAYIVEKGGNDMQNSFWSYFVAMLAGFAVILLPSYGSVFAGLHSTFAVVGTVIVLFFSLVLSWQALYSLFK